MPEGFVTLEGRLARALSGALKHRAKGDGRGIGYGYGYGYAGGPGKILDRTVAYEREEIFSIDAY